MFEGMPAGAVGASPFYNGNAQLDAGQRMEELRKALETSYLRQDQVGGQSMVPQSLEPVLVSTTFKERHLVMWKDMPKEKARSTIEEFTTLTDVGERGHEGTGFFVQGGKPDSSDLTAARKFAPVKFMGTERGFTHPMTQVRSLGGPEGLPANDPEAKEVFAGTRWLLRQLERVIPFGDANIIPTGITGLQRQILGTDASPYANIVAGKRNIIDLRGASVTMANLNEAAQVIEDNFGDATAARLYMSNSTLTDISNYLLASGNLFVNPLQGMNQANVAGKVVTGFRSQFGEFPFRNCRFLDVEADTPPAARTAEKAPAAPTLDTTYHSVGYFVDDPGEGELSKFVSADAGNFYYKITAINHWGESAPLTVGPIVVAAGKVVRIALNQSGGKWTSTNDSGGCMGYRVYRTAVGAAATTCKYIDQVAADDCAGDLVVDCNYFMPGTSRAFLSDMTPEDSIGMRILTPLLKFPLAIVDTRIRFLLLLYLSHVILYSNMKHVEFINIGRYEAE